MQDEQKFTVSPVIVQAARRMAKGCTAGEDIEYQLQMEVNGEVHIDDFVCHGEWQMTRRFMFEVLEDLSVKYKGTVTALNDETIHRGKPKMLLKTCGHPLGCGDVCGWCAVSAALLDLIDVAISGDVEKTMEVMERSTKLLKKQGISR